MKFDVTIRTLTPLHIGTGTILLRDYDYVTAGGRTFVLNQDAIYSDIYSQTLRIPDKPAGKLIDPSELRDGSPLVRYSLAGTTTVDQIHEQIKDARGQCYLPGSSLKGALRTVLLAAAYPQLAEVGVNYEENRRGGLVKEKAAKNFERAAFRPGEDDPNHDLLRAFQVTDSAPIKPDPSPLMLVQARAFGDRPAAVPIWVEALAQGQMLHATLRLDDWLLAEKQARKLGWQVSRDWFTQLPAFSNARAKKELEDERAFAESRTWEFAVKAYDQLARHLERAQRQPQQFLLQVGWGTGWNGITIGTLLPRAEQLRAREQFELGKPPRLSKREGWAVDPNQPYPTTRRLFDAGKSNERPIPSAPLGWISVELT